MPFESLPGQPLHIQLPQLVTPPARPVIPWAALSKQLMDQINALAEDFSPEGKAKRQLLQLHLQSANLHLQNEIQKSKVLQQLYGGGFKGEGKWVGGNWVPLSEQEKATLQLKRIQLRQAQAEEAQREGRGGYPAPKMPAELPPQGGTLKSGLPPFTPSDPTKTFETGQLPKGFKASEYTGPDTTPDQYYGLDEATPQPEPEIDSGSLPAPEEYA